MTLCDETFYICRYDSDQGGFLSEPESGTRVRRRQQQQEQSQQGGNYRDIGRPSTGNNPYYKNQVAKYVAKGILTFFNNLLQYTLSFSQGKR